MIVRSATPEDFPQIVPMGAAFFATTSYADFASFDPVSAERLGEFLLTDGILLVAEQEGVIVGMVGLVVAPFLFNHALRTAHEVMWWVNEDARHSGAGVALLRAVEPACRDAGAVAIQMIHLHNSPPQAGALYDRLGFRHTESSYTKVLT